MNGFPYQKSRCKVNVNVMTHPELGVLKFKLDKWQNKLLCVGLKTNYLLFIRSEKNCSFELGVKTSLITIVSNGLPLIMIHDSLFIIHYSLLSFFASDGTSSLFFRILFDKHCYKCLHQKCLIQ